METANTKKATVLWVDDEIDLLKAKKQAIESQEEQDKKYQEVIKAIASYSGKDGEWEEVPDGYDY